VAAAFLAYAPRGPGLRCALAYLLSEEDVYGWFTGLRHDGSTASCYFLLADFYANAPTSYEAVDQSDLHAHWSLAEARRHELAAMQEAFAREWLFYRGNLEAPAELQTYAENDLAASEEVNVRFERLSRLSDGSELLTYRSPGFDRMVIKHLAKHWPLAYHLHLERRAPPHKHRASAG